MKEYTLTYTVEITDIIYPDDTITEEDIMSITPQELAEAFKQITDVDHVSVSDLKVFITHDN
jgi:hypothetical protein